MCLDRNIVFSEECALLAAKILVLISSVLFLVLLITVSRYLKFLTATSSIVNISPIFFLFRTIAIFFRH
jgi:hypothetical protein